MGTPLEGIGSLEPLHGTSFGQRGHGSFPRCLLFGRFSARQFVLGMLLLLLLLLLLGASRVCFIGHGGHDAQTTSSLFSTRIVATAISGRRTFTPTQSSTARRIMQQTRGFFSPTMATEWGWRSMIFQRCLVVIHHIGNGRGAGRRSKPHGRVVQRRRRRCSKLTSFLSLLFDELSYPHQQYQRRYTTKEGLVFVGMMIDPYYSTGSRLFGRHKTPGFSSFDFPQPLGKDCG